MRTLREKPYISMVLALLLLGSGAHLSYGGDFLFDASKHEMGGNADWIIDADSWNLNMAAYPCSGTTNESNPQRLPTPDQSLINASTPETFWTGGISAWAVDLVKAGHTVETLPDTGAITYGDGANPQDLSNYDVFIIPEPQNPFTAAEAQAIIDFVTAGGGLFMVADHETSDRECDGWDSPMVFNALTGATSASDAGIFGIWFRVDGSSTKPSEDWFDDPVDNNVETDPSDPIIQGPFGSGAGGLGLFGSTSMDLNSLDNPMAKAHVWRTGQAHNDYRVTFATSQYGMGRVAAIGDSSPADDDTGDPGDSLWPGWDKASGGVNNREIHLNACHWLLNPTPDTTPPSITGGPSAAPGDCSATISWTTDEPATSSVDWGLTAAYGSSASQSGHHTLHEVTLSGLAPSTPYHYRVNSSDSVGNGPTQSADDTFTTLAAASPTITAGPSAGSITGTSAVITWTTNEAATSEAQYGTSDSYGDSASVPGYATVHTVPLSGLTPMTTYHYRVLSADACGNGPAVSGDATFTTGPASTDVSGWTVKQFNSTLTYTIPPGTTIPSNGYLVIARDATRAEFEAFFPTMPAETVFLNSNESGSCANGCLPQVNGGETFELWDGATPVDGPTISMSSDNAYQRVNPGDPANQGSSWNTVPEASADPGQGAGTGSGAGVVFNELADASDYTKEYVELYNDAGISPPDEIPPAAVSDLAAIPLSDTSIRLEWTASGDDGTTGTATAYNIRRSSQRILTLSDFDAATSVSGVPGPSVAGSAEEVTVGGLAADTPYYFALKVADEVPNVSALSNCAGGVTAPVGGGGPSTDHLVISQIQIQGDDPDDEFVELYNPTGDAISIDGWSLQYMSATGPAVSNKQDLSGSVASHGYFLAARPEYDGVPARDFQCTGINMGKKGGHIFLVQSTTMLTGSCPFTGNIVDKVAWVSGNCPEGTAVSAPAANNSVERLPGGTNGSGQDTDDNSDDFQTLTPSVPRNSSSPAATPSSSLGNVRATLFLEKGATETELEWAAAAGATGYLVYRGTAPDFMGASPAPWRTPADNNTADITQPSPVFYYVVLATDGSDVSED